MPNFRLRFIPFFLLIGLIACQSKEMNTAHLDEVKWIHGSPQCDDNTDLAIQVVQYDPHTWILRQNKCIDYEAPFMFLFIGDNKALLMDTGATADEHSFPLYNTVHRLITDWEKKNNKSVELIVAHTHNHGDHKAGDIQFQDKPKTTVVGLEVKDLTEFFQIDDWPDENAVFDLGNRPIVIIPIPGHEPASIALYDQTTQLLLTGDSFYPGRLYIRDWMAFKRSIQRLVDFVANHQVSYILGNHIEMTSIAGKDYPTGTTFQPQEHRLPLGIKDLQRLNKALGEAGDKPVMKVQDDFIIYPK